MTPLRRMLLLVGSPKPTRSTSEALGSYLLERLTHRGMQTETVHVHRALRSGDGIAGLLAATDRADLVVLAFPLYVDSLPAPVIKALELIARHRQQAGSPDGPWFLGISNSGFPEPAQNATALAICRQFAREAGLRWAGGLAVGGGGLVGGRPLTEAGRVVRPIIRALDLAAAALADGRPVPEAAHALLAKPVVAPWLYRLVGNLGFWREARKSGVTLRSKPYKL